MAPLECDPILPEGDWAAYIDGQKVTSHVTIRDGQTSQLEIRKSTRVSLQEGQPMEEPKKYTLKGKDIGGSITRNSNETEIHPDSPGQALESVIYIKGSYRHR